MHAAAQFQHTSAPFHTPAPHHQPPPSSQRRQYFSLERSEKDDDVALFQDARTGFSHLLPGRPRLDPGAALGCDAVVRLQDIPVTLRYTLEAPRFHARSAEDLARQTALRYATVQARGPKEVRVDSTHPTWLGRWGVEAAAVATYNVEEAAVTIGNWSAQARAVMREDLFVLVRQGMVYVVTWTYAESLAEEIAYASFASVAEATMIWDPLRWEQRGRVWPDSAFVTTGVDPSPKPKYNEMARHVARVGLSDAESDDALVVLAGIISGAGAPWVVLSPTVIEANRHAILSSFETQSVRQAIDHAFFEVRTAHDLRGLAILLGRALENRRR